MRSTKSPSWIERLLGSGPLPPPPHAFALDGGRLAYARFERDGEPYVCRETAAEELPPDAFQHGPLGGPLREPAVFNRLVEHLLGRISAPVKEASLTIPDAWLRVAFAESGELPAAGQQRTEVLRWKLKRLVPFHVEELRVDAIDVPPLPGQSEPRRLLLGFAIDALLTQVEASFAAHGVRLGRITSHSLAALAALDDDGGGAGDGEPVTCLALADGDGYTLLFARGGEPLLHRYKALTGGARGDLIRRDLALTRLFLGEQIPGAVLGRVLLLAPPASEAAWLGWLGEGLDAPAEALGAAHLPPMSGDPLDGSGRPWHEVAPLLGAARLEVV